MFKIYMGIYSKRYIHSLKKCMKGPGMNKVHARKERIHNTSKENFFPNTPKNISLS